MGGLLCLPFKSHESLLSLSLSIWSLLSLLCLSSVHRPVTGVPPILIRSILRSWLASLIVIVVCCRPYIVGYAAVSLLLGPCAYSSPWTTPHQYLISSSGSLYLSPCPRDVNARSQMNLSLSLSHTNAHTPVLVLPLSCLPVVCWRQMLLALNSCCCCDGGYCWLVQPLRIHMVGCLT